MAAQAVRRPGISKVARSRPTGWSKSCDLYPTFAPCKWSSGDLSSEGRGVTASLLDRQFLTLLSAAGNGRLQLGVAHCATSVALLQVVDN